MIDLTKIENKLHYSFRKGHKAREIKTYSGIGQIQYIANHI